MHMNFLCFDHCNSQNTARTELKVASIIYQLKINLTIINSILNKCINI